MQIKLSEIANIQYGVYAKSAYNGSARYLNVGHFDGHGNLKEDTDSRILVDTKTEKFLLQTNDVLLAAKGSRIFAWAYQAKQGSCIPSSSFYIIKTDSNRIIGEYLAYILNAEKTQFKIGQMLTGGGMPSIPKKELLELEITVPNIDKQKKAVEIANTIDEAIQLTEQLVKQKKLLKRGIINKLLNL
jgi:restriction endonuclease S subunit